MCISWIIKWLILLMHGYNHEDFHDVWYLSIFRIPVGSSSFFKVWRGKIANLNYELFTFTIISRRVLPIMRNVWEKICRGKKHILLFNNFLFCFVNRAVHEIMSKNAVEFAQDTDVNMAHAHSMRNN